MSEYTYTDRDGDKLTIERANGSPDTAYLNPGDNGVYVPAVDLPQFVAALYRAAGQVPPTMDATKPDPELQKLADVIDGSTPLSRDDAERIARAVLAAGYVRGES